MRELRKEIEKAFNEPVKLSIKKEKDGQCSTEIQGTTLSILIALAGLEKSTLERLDVPPYIWAFVKEIVGTKEVKHE